MFRKETRALPEEKQAVINYVKGNYPLNSMFLKQGYRRISFEMLDKNVVALGPSQEFQFLFMIYHKSLYKKNKAA